MNARDVLHVPERSTMKRTKSSLLAFKLREVSIPPSARTHPERVFHRGVPMHLLP